MKTNRVNLLIIALVTLLSTFSSCAFKTINRSKNVEYLPAGASGNEAQMLNIFSPKKNTVLKDVLIFIHGGNWNSGKPSIYNFFGARLARKEVVAVIIEYPLSPKATYKEMAFATAAAVTWVKQHIAQYGGNPEKIFISGHSAGGHLAALVSLDNSYFDSLATGNPIKGTILIDAAGLTMYDYLHAENFEQGHTYLNTFTNDPVQWKKASPVNFVHRGMPRMLIYQGGKTYPSIKEANEKFVQAVQQYAPSTPYYILKGKKHVPMILQFFWSWNPHYKTIIDFMNDK